MFECLSLGCGSADRQCDGAGAPQTRCWLGALLNSHELFLLFCRRRAFHHCCSGRIQPHPIQPPPTPPHTLPPFTSHVSIPSRAWSDEAYQGTENSLPLCCFLLFLCMLLPVTDVCCFHRKLASLPLKKIFRYLLVKLFSTLCMDFFLSLSCSHFPHRTSDRYKKHPIHARIVSGLHFLRSTFLNIRLWAHLWSWGWRSPLLPSPSEGRSH